jgi:Tfp pilus assembly protein PilV
VLKPINNNKGLSIVECLIALILTTVAVVSLVSMQSLAWRGAGKSDYLGRAVGILQRELERYEYDLMKGNTIASDTITYADKNGNDMGTNTTGAVFTIRVAASAPASIPAGTQLLNVRINWPGCAKGLSSSIIVSPQTGF